TLVPQILTLPFRAAMDTIGHEHVHVLQVHDENKTGLLTTNTSKAKDLLSKADSPLLGMANFLNACASLGTLPYLRNDAEIQARLHTVLAKGYRDRWQQLPATRHELWGALVSSGLNAPPAIRRALDSSAEEGLSRL